MTSSFRNKFINTVSNDQAKGVWQLLKQYTFPNDPDTQQGTSSSPLLAPESQSNPTHTGFSDPGGPATKPPFDAQYIVPGDFLKADFTAQQRNCDVKSESHEMRTCWCRIVSDPALAESSWSFDGSQYTTDHISSNDVYKRIDAFGNTAFHHLATNLVATIDNRVFFINLISLALMNPTIPTRNRNTAGQTFLHVLHDSWFDEDSALSLDELVNKLKDANFDYLATDVYGRSFFHLLQNKRNPRGCIPASLFNWALLRRRDAFGVNPLESRMRQATRRSSPLNAATGSINAEPPSLTMLDITHGSGSGSGEEARIATQTMMLRLVVDAVKVEGVNSTLPNPRVEDVHGRNALHCLAEVKLDAAAVREGRNGQDTGRPSNQRRKKRKLEGHDRYEFSDNDESNTTINNTTNCNDRRIDYLRGILLARVDVNHYDLSGQTPLMAFIRHRPEDSRADRQDMEDAIQMLYKHGAQLELRNRAGETALHVAAREGKVVALKMLLSLGANPYVRDAAGLSVLSVIDEMFVNSDPEDGGVFMARLEACRAIFTGAVVEGDPQDPSLLEEWGVRRQDPMEL